LQGVFPFFAVFKGGAGMLQDVLGYPHLALDIFVPVTPVEEQVLNGRADSWVLLNRANKTVDFLAGEADDLVGFGEKEGVTMPVYQLVK
jgi:hypothetical protein